MMHLFSRYTARTMLMKGVSAVAAASFLFSSPVYAQDIGVMEKPLNLPSALNIALENNPDLSSIVKTLNKSEYLHVAASKAWMPVLSTDYTFLGMPNQLEMEDDTSGNFPIMDYTSLIWGTHVKMPVYTAGAVQYKKNIAELGVDVAKMRFLEAKIDLIQEVTINYLHALRARNYMKVVNENLTRFTQHEAMTEKYYKTGLVAKNALLEIQVKKAHAHQDLITAEKNLRLAKAALNVSMGIDINSRFRLEDITYDKEIPFTTKECLGLARKRNPSLVAFFYLQKRAGEIVHLEGTAAQPTIEAGVSFWKHGRTPELRGDDYITNDVFMGMVTAKWLIWDWLKTEDLMKARKEELYGIIDKHAALEQKISFDIQEAFLNMRTAKNKFDVAQKEIEYAEENYRISKLRYDEKVARSTEVNDALVLQKRSQFSYYDAFYEYNVALARLERIIGTNVEIEPPKVEPTGEPREQLTKDTTL